MHKGRLEAFSDGVLAIIITIMVLELKTPHEPGIGALYQLIPVMLGYLLSFIYVGIYWNNHHHLMQAAHHVNGSVLWANLHLLFWLSLVPFVTGWMSETHFAPVPVATYGVILLMAAIAFLILARALIRLEGPTSTLARATGTNSKEKLSLVLYTSGVLLAFVRPWIGCLIYAVAALLWLIPDRRIEKVMGPVAGG